MGNKKMNHDFLLVRNVIQNIPVGILAENKNTAT